MESGWDLVNFNPAGAVKAFADALKIRPSDALANYGLGYAYLQQANTGLASEAFCQALRHANPQSEQDIVRDVTGLLEANGLSCP